MDSPRNQVDDVLSNLDPQLAAVLGEAPAGPPPGSTASMPGETVSETEPRVTRTEIREARREAHEEKKEAVNPSLRKLGKAAKLVSDPSKFRIYKIHNGQLALIGDVNLRDVDNAGDVETYLNRFTKPVWKGGEYHVKIVDIRGQAWEGGIYQLLDPPEEAKPSESVAVGILRDTIKNLEQKMNAPRQMDPVEEALRKQVVDKIVNGSKSDTGGQSDLMSILVLKMLSPQPTTDPTMAALLDRMDRRMETLEKQMRDTASAPPLPPPGPVTDPAVTMATMLEKLIPLVRQERDPNALSTRDVIELVKSAQPTPPTRDPDQPTWRDLLQIMQDQRAEQKPQQTVLDQIEAVARAKEALERISPPSQPAGATFWDALGALFSQEKFGAGVGQAISAAVQRKGPTPGPQVSVENRRPAQSPQVAPPTAPAGHLAAQPQERPKIVLPESMRELGQKLDAAQHDGERLDLAVQAIWAVYPAQMWRKFVEDLFDKAAQDQRDAVITDYLTPFFGILAAHGLIKKETGQATLRAFREHWTEVHHELQRRVAAMRAAPATPTTPTPTPSDAIQPEIVEAQDRAEDEEADDNEEVDEENIVDLPDDVMAELEAANTEPPSV